MVLSGFLRVRLKFNKMFKKIKEKLKKFKIWIIALIIGGMTLAVSLNTPVGDVPTLPCDINEAKAVSIINSLVDKSISEKTKIKSCEIAKSKYIGTYINSVYGVEIEIQSIKNIESNGWGGVEIMARAWKGNKQLGFGKNGTIEIERFKVWNPPVLIEDPTGDIVQTNEIKIGLTHTRTLKEDPLRAIQESLAHTVKLVGKTNGKIVKGSIGNTTSTFYPAAGSVSPVDGRVWRSVGTNESWASIQGGNGTNKNDAAIDSYYAGWLSGTDSATFYELYRAIHLFATGDTIPTTDTVDSGTFSWWPTLKEHQSSAEGNKVETNVYASSPAANDTLAIGDYQTMGTTAYATAIAYDSLTTGAYNDYTLNATGLAAVAKGTGTITKFGIRDSNHDAPNSAPTWQSETYDDVVGYYADQTGTTSDPKLVIVHSAAAADEIKKQSEFWW